LNDALLATHDILQRVVELQGNQQRKDLTEDSLKDSVLEWIERAPQQRGNNLSCKAVQRHEDDQAHDHRECEPDEAFEALIERQNGPFRPKRAPLR